MKLDEYHYMIIFLLVAASVAMYQAQQFYPQLIVIPLIAAAADFGINYYKTKQVSFPFSAIISGLIIASIMPQIALHVQIIAALLAVLQKHVIRWRGSHIFNPAAFSVLVTSLLFQTAPSWWTAISAVVLIFLLTANMVRRLPIAVSFYALHVLLSGASLGALLDYTAIFFALVMSVEPKTTPISQKGMVVFGAWIAVLSAIIHYTGLAVDPFIASLMVMNIFTKYLNKLR